MSTRRNNMKFVVVGGVAGGMSAATRLRRLNENAEIIIIDKGPYVSFANCGLPYHVSGLIPTLGDLLVQTPESLYARFRLDVRVNSEVVKIEPEKKLIQVVGPDGEYAENYDKLILSPGAEAITPNIDGLDSAKNVFTLRDIPDLVSIMDCLNTNEVKRAVVIGAGFIGLEMVENLVFKGINVTLIEQAPQVLTPLDIEMAKHIELELKANGVHVITSQAVQAFENEGRSIIISDGSQIETDMTILSIGVRPASRLAADAGIKLGLRGGIEVDENYQTSIEDIYAVGDAIVVKQSITGEDALIALASPANRQGRQVADVLSGIPRKNKGSIGTSIVKVFDLTAASTGLNERQVKDLGLDYMVTHTSGNHHAGYYPGATPIYLKLVFEKGTGKIFGAQAVGKNGVDKRIDILATAIKADLNVWDLPELEFTYAPPFGSAKDPVNMAGYQAINILEGISETIQWYELEDYVNNGWKILDLRIPEEIQAYGGFKDAINIPIDALRDRLNELDTNQKYILACATGLRSYIGERVLKQHNFIVKNLDGSFDNYNAILPEHTI